MATISARFWRSTATFWRADSACDAVVKVAYHRQWEDLSKRIDVAEGGGLPGASELEGLVGFKVDGSESGFGFDLHKDFVKDGLCPQSSTRNLRHRQQSHGSNAVLGDEQRAAE